MKKVTGLGGVFFKWREPKASAGWYREHLGIIPTYGNGSTMVWRDARESERLGFTAWSPFASDTDYFNPGKSPFMVNFRVDNVRLLLAELKAAGVRVDEKVDSYEYGKFGWIMDPEDNRVELWEPCKDLATNNQFDALPEGGQERTLGIADFSFKARDPEALQHWYSQHLGLSANARGDLAFSWRRLDEPERVETTLFRPLAHDHEIFDGAENPYVVSYRVRDCGVITAGLDRPFQQADGVVLLIDPEGSRLQLEA